MDINKRIEPRTATALDAVVSMNDEAIPCHLKDISSKGAKVICDAPLIVGAEISLILEPFGTLKGDVVWVSDNACGIKFNDRAEAIEAVLLGLASYATA